MPQVCYFANFKQYDLMHLLKFFGSVFCTLFHTSLQNDTVVLDRTFRMSNPGVPGRKMKVDGEVSSEVCLATSPELIHCSCMKCYKILTSWKG